jgi:tRNA pseudouridine55 synthase
MTELHGLLVIDKPRGWTSHDVVAWLRRRLRQDRVGHGGTLDPAAEGVLLVAVGQAARLTPFLQEATKEYLAHIVLGAVSTSDDLEGELLSDGQPAVPPTIAQVDDALHRFQGEIEQVPPVFSAIKMGGSPLYRQARAGRPVRTAPRRVFIYRTQLLHFAYPDVLVAVECGKGVYLRSLARDLGVLLGTGAYLHGLLRTRVGPFGLSAAWPLELLERLLSAVTWPHVALHPDASLSDYPALLLSAAQGKVWYHGAPVRGAGAYPDQPVARVYSSAGNWMGLARYQQARRAWMPALVLPDRID